MSNRKIPDEVILILCNTLRDTIGLVSHVQDFELSQQPLKIQSIVVKKLDEFGYRVNAVEAFARLRKVYPAYCREERRVQDLDKLSGIDSMIDNYRLTGTF